MADGRSRRILGNAVRRGEGLDRGDVPGMGARLGRSKGEKEACFRGASRPSMGGMFGRWATGYLGAWPWARSSGLAGTMDLVAAPGAELGGPVEAVVSRTKRSNTTSL